MRKLFLALILLGGFLFACGFLYDVLFAGIPYQDPTPALSNQYAAHRLVASLLYRAGGFLSLAGAALGLIQGAVSALRGRSSGGHPPLRL
jgi:hypothetical protein